MLKYALLIALTVISIQFAQSDDRPDNTNDTEQTATPKGFYQKLGLTTGETTTVPNEEGGQPEREPAEAQPEQQREDGNTIQQPRDTSDQPVN